MNRLFGSKSSAPKATLSDAITSTESRVESLDVKIASLNAELTTHQQRISRLRPGPGQSALKQKALKLLQRRKAYEAQRDQLSQQSWNMSQADTMQSSLASTMITVDALRRSNKALKKQYRAVDIDAIERMQDEMQELMERGEEIQESISRAYEVPEEDDEEELDAELEALGEEGMFESGIGVGTGAGEVPGFLVDEVPGGKVPEFIDEPPEAGKVKQAAG